MTRGYQGPSMMHRAALDLLPDNGTRGLLLKLHKCKIACCKCLRTVHECHTWMALVCREPVRSLAPQHYSSPRSDLFCIRNQTDTGLGSLMFKLRSSINCTKCNTRTFGRPPRSAHVWGSTSAVPQGPSHQPATSASLELRCVTLATPALPCAQGQAAPMLSPVEEQEIPTLCH